MPSKAPSTPQGAYTPNSSSGKLGGIPSAGWWPEPDIVCMTDSRRDHQRNGMVHRHIVRIHMDIPLDKKEASAVKRDVAKGVAEGYAALTKVGVVKAHIRDAAWKHGLRLLKVAFQQDLKAKPAPIPPRTGGISAAGWWPDVDLIWLQDVSLDNAQNTIRTQHVFRLEMDIELNATEVDAVRAGLQTGLNEGFAALKAAGAVGSHWDDPTWQHGVRFIKAAFEQPE